MADVLGYTKGSDQVNTLLQDSGKKQKKQKKQKLEVRNLNYQLAGGLKN
ncbi:hypothetical protein [Mastigocoleus sp. MO_188.B34]|nr:hypothetical protein [Mastigocoleus sp. MO_188.B34]MDJ0697688.1 hypothetical protein [Mastigocoleus sp. MO_188.B34]